MKKISFVLIVLFVSINSFSQSTQFGIKAGLNLADLKDEFVSAVDSRTGYHVGVLAHIHLNKTWALQPEVVYSLQGAEYSEGRNRLNYINIPVLLQYMHSSGFRFETGPQLGILTDATAKRDGENFDIDNLVSGTDISWAFGAGYLTRSGFGIDARYNLGLNDIRQDENNVYDLKNRVFQVGVFYQFGRLLK